MSRHILTLNAGSSTIKFAAFAVGAGAPAREFVGKVERIGSAEASLAMRDAEGGIAEKYTLSADASRDHESAMGEILAVLERELPGAVIEAVGHRVVHGANAFAEPVVVDDAVMAKLATFSPFAPLHQPHNLAGIAAARDAFPKAVQIAAFDTAFHRGQPFVADTFALPRAHYDKGVRRYGFHGLSYDYISGVLAEREPALHAGRTIVAHLGNGASMCALKGGRSIGSTMGFSALDGLPMGTRCGQIDPGVLLYLLSEEKMTPDALSDLLYRQSGLLGLSGLSNDMRTLEEAGTEAAEEAIQHFVYRITVEVGALAAMLGGLDGLVFTAGIGENSRRVRADVCAGLGFLGVAFDADANAGNAPVISAPESRVRVMMLRTDEESVIARDVARLIGA